MTELIWDGKYDKDGRKSAPLRVALPFQTVETVNESTSDRLRTRDLFAEGRAADWRNRLIWGDKKYVLPSLLEELSGQVNLIYIDPPFDTGADFSFTTTVPDSDESFTKEPSIIEQKAYRDTWGKGLDSYLQWFYETVVLLHELLAEDGSLYVHLDWHVAHYAKAVLDEVFGQDTFVNEIVWKRQTAKGDVTQGAKHMGRIHESVYLYTKSDGYTWNVQYTPYDESYVEAFYRYTDPDGRRYQLSDISAPGGGQTKKGNPYYEFLGVTRYWRFSKKRMEEMHRQGRIVQTAPGTVPRQRRYLDEMPGVPLQDLWLDIKPVQSQSHETVAYSTQKPEALLERIIKASTREPESTYIPDLVLDCFCGSGTTPAVAEKLGRRWIACDLGRFAIHTTRKRLLEIPGVRPFVVQNLGKYERQAWQSTEFGNGGKGERESGRTEEAEERQRAYIEFILKLVNARTLKGYTYLHGVKAGRMVHVGAVDAPVSVGDVTNIATEFRRAMGTGKDAPTTNGVDVLGWDFAFELNEVARQQAAAANLNMRFLRIPRDVMDKRAVEQGDIHFFELAALSVEVEVQKAGGSRQKAAKERTVVLSLTNFIIPPDDVPEDVRQAVKHWEQWIDYWAVDWNNHSDTFHNEWQSYRTRKDKSLLKQTTHTYEAPGTYTVVVKVIDILGNDTTKTLKVTV